MFRRRLAALAILAAVPFLLLACSSNDGSKTGGLKAPSTTSKVSAPPASDGTDVPDAEDTDPPETDDTDLPTDDVPGGGSDDTGDAAAFCKLVQHPDYLMGEYGTDKGNPDAIAEKLQTIDDAAPAEIKDDVDLVADTMASAANGDTTAMQSAGSPEFQTAQHNYMGWRAKHCA